MIEDTVCSRLEQAEEKNLCILLSEELLLHLLQMGRKGIQVKAKGKKHPYVELSVQGEADPFFVLDSVHRAEDLSAEVNSNILRHNDQYIEYHYHHQTSWYRIYPRQKESVALTQDILAYYNQDEEILSKRNRATGLLFWLAGKYPAMAAAGLLLRLFRHLAALLLPVFAAIPKSPPLCSVKC